VATRQSAPGDFESKVSSETAAEVWGDLRQLLPGPGTLVENALALSTPNGVVEIRALAAGRFRARMLFAAVLCTALAACTLYRPQPLDGPDRNAILASPDRAALERAARLLEHPRLPRVTLDFSQPLTPDEVAVVAVLANPDLRALRAQQRVADAQVFASGLLPDPQLSVGYDRVLSPQTGYFNSYTSAMSFDVLGALVTRSVERRVAVESATRLRLDIAWQEWATAAEARVLALRLWYQSHAARLARAAADTAERALARSLTAAERHDLKADEIEIRRIAVADATGRALAAERDTTASRLELNRLLGLTPTEQLALAPPRPLPEWHAPDPAALFTAAQVERLDLQALAAGYRSQEAALHRAILGQYPRVVLTLNRARDTSRVQTIGPAVSLDLPLWNRNRGAIRIAAADRQRLSTEYAARLHQTRADIAALVAALDRDEATRAAFAAEAPELERIAGAYEQAAERSDTTRPVSEAARAAAIDRALALLASQQACAEERIALALATGRPLSESEFSP
jgi:outer membrane protein TolC